MNNERPNIFRYATSELSQDAFLCWLLEWGKPTWGEKERKNEDQALHRTALHFLQRLFEKGGKELPASVDSLDVRRQYKHMDIVITVNNEYVVIIEDKTGTADHSNQLQRYLDEIKTNGVADRAYSVDAIVPIYLKTRDQSDYANVERSDYRVFERHDVLSVLEYGNDQGVRDSIFADYRRYLIGLEDAVASYANLPLDEWTGDSWTGFFMKLKEEFRQAGWGYVPNPSGGFMGFW